MIISLHCVASQGVADFTCSTLTNTPPGRSRSNTSAYSSRLRPSPPSNESRPGLESSHRAQRQIVVWNQWVGLDKLHVHAARRDLASVGINPHHHRVGSIYLTILAAARPLYAYPIALLIVSPAVWIAGTASLVAGGRLSLIGPFLLGTAGVWFMFVIAQIFLAQLAVLATVPLLVCLNGLALILFLEFIRHQHQEPAD